MSTQLALRDISGLLSDLFRKLESDQGEEWLQGFKKFLRKETTWEKPEIFKIIKIGTHKDVKVLRTALENSGVRIGNWAGDILSKTKLAKSKQSLNLVVKSVKELGFPEGASYQNICKAADAQGLDICPAEVGPQLRLQYLDQPEGEWLVVAMEPIKDSDGDLSLFYVKRASDVPWLGALYGKPDSFWGAGFRFVFVSRK